ncbi:MAG: cation-efflux pump [Bacteroidetes bacterium CG2_30_32_10]|nr:MAG: cation-efflux pump [Bacteroidetes bacterium CG2_30_32_10]
MNKKTKVARLSIFSNTLLIICKVIVGVITGSVSIISEAIHSSMDLLAAIIAFLSVKISDTPPDKQHPYGHGKYENISGVIEAILIFVAAIWIVYEAVKKLTGANPVESIGIGSMVMFFSAIVNYIVSKQLYKVAKSTDSIALEADSLHLKADVYTSLGVGVGLLLIWITDWHILDPIVAILVAIFILRESFFLLKKAYSPLLDVKLPDQDIVIIEASIHKFTNGKFNYHQLRTRKAGFYKYVDLHLELPSQFTVEEAHQICDKIENDIEAKIKHIEVHIHVEPIETKKEN